MGPRGRSDRCFWRAGCPAHPKALGSFSPHPSTQPFPQRLRAVRRDCRQTCVSPASVTVASDSVRLGSSWTRLWGMATTSCRQLTARPGRWCRCHLFLAGNRRATRGFRRLAHAHQPLFKLCPGAAPLRERAEDLLQHCQLPIERPGRADRETVPGVLRDLRRDREAAREEDRHHRDLPQAADPRLPPARRSPGRPGMTAACATSDPGRGSPSYRARSLQRHEPATRPRSII